MSANFSFSMESSPNFTFNLYENVPVGEHTATIKDIVIEKGKATKYGLKDRFTIIFQLHELNREFNYYFDKSYSENSKYYSFFKMICDALGRIDISEDIIGQTFIIDISLVPHFNNSDKIITKITNIRKDEKNIAKCS